MKPGWQLKKLGEICDFQNGFAFKSNLFRETGLPILRISNIKNETIETCGVVYFQLEDYKENLDKYRVENGDLLIAMSGATTGKIGFNLTNELFYLNQRVGKFKPKDGLLKNFLFYFLSTRVEENLLISAGAAQPNLSTEQVKNFIIPLPPLSEQKRIVAILDEAFAGIATAKANTEKNLQNARAIFESHLNSIDAQRVPLGNLVDIKTGKLDANAAIEGGFYPFFTCSREIYTINHYAFDCEAILLAGNNAVGDFNVKHYHGKFNAYQRTYVITVNEKNKILYRFLYFQLLKSLAKFKSQSVGTGTKFLKLGMIQNMEVSLPEIKEQKLIVEKIDAILEETQRLESNYKQKLAALDELKKSLLHRAFSGEL